MARRESASAGTALRDEEERERRTLPLASMRPLMRVERPARKTLPPSMEALLSMARRGAMLEMREKERERRVQEDVVLLETGLNEIPVLRDVVVLKSQTPINRGYRFVEDLVGDAVDPLRFQAAHDIDGHVGAQMNKLLVHASDDRDFVIRLDRHVRATVQNPLHSHSDDVYSSAIVPSRFTTPLQFSIKLPPNLIVD